MTDWYSYVNSTNNTLTNRNILLTRLTIDPNLSQYNPLAVNFVDSSSIVVQFGNVLSDSDDATLTQKMIDIIFNDSSPDKSPQRNAISTSDPTVEHDYYSNFVTGSGWLNTSNQKRYECVSNTVDNALWLILPYVGTTGTGTGATGSYPYDGSVLQYNDVSEVWISQPGKYQSITINSIDMNLSDTSPPILGTGGTYLFQNGQTQEMIGFTTLPNDYMENSDVIFNIGFETTTSATGTVAWGINYDWINIGDTFSSFSGITGLSTTNALQYQYINKDLPPISGSGKSILSAIKYTIYRDGTNVNDTYPDSVSLLYVNLSYNTNGTGSSQAFIK